MIRLAPDGREVLSRTLIGDEVCDLAVDGAGRIHVACGALGYNVLAEDGRPLRRLGVHAYRVDATADGTAAVLVPSIPNEDAKPGPGEILVFDDKGRELLTFAGQRNTLDLCLDAENRQVITIGWRQTTAHDGVRKEPVQIAYLLATGFDGDTRWSGYDWSTDRTRRDSLNASTNNMADTRGYRVTIGLDGKLYAAFEAAGGNHQFRWSPTDIHAPVAIVGGDPHHSWHSTKSEHKTFIGRYDPKTGAYLAGQQFCARLENGRGNTARVHNGAIAADAEGRVYVGGSAAHGLPVSLDPLPAGTRRGGAYVLVLSPDLKERELCTRLSGDGWTRAIALRPDGAGFAMVGNAGAALHVVEPVQPAFGGKEQDGFLALFATVEPAPSGE
ncbi:MAG TPA: hypothetical protein VEL07_05970 [Planctomycetota bacterium]|nr:hypothetical protein [Planctomycetota bacterium]